MRVTICDVGPRDGLQTDPKVLEPSVRAELVDRLAGAGMPIVGVPVERQQDVHAPPRVGSKLVDLVEDTER